MKIKEYPCSICGSASFTEIYANRHSLVHSTDGYKLMMSSSSHAPLVDALARCNDCGHSQTNPRLDMEEVLKGYASAIDPDHVKQDKYREKTFVRAISHLDSLSKFRSTGNFRVLDIGCASGAFLNSVSRKYGWQGVGLEPSEWMCEFGKQTYGLDLRSDYFSAGLFAPNSFDLVTLWDVLEHIAEPNQVLNDIALVLDDDGYLILNVPNSKSIAARIFGRRWPFLLAVHIHYFTPKSINEILAKHGFELVESRPYFQSLGFGYLLRRGLNILGWRIGASNAASLLDKISLVYNMGQTTFVAKKRKQP
jgi:predicted TPR repeat methyltransferase